MPKTDAHYSGIVDVGGQPLDTHWPTPADRKSNLHHNSIRTCQPAGSDVGSYQPIINKGAV